MTSHDEKGKSTRWERVAGLPAMRKLLQARAHFADTVTSVCERLRVIRKELSREYDVPVANVGGLFEAATDRRAKRREHLNLPQQGIQRGRESRCGLGEL